MADWILDPDKGVRPTYPECPFPGEGGSCGGEMSPLPDDISDTCTIGVERIGGVDTDRCGADATLICPKCGITCCDECGKGNWHNR